MAQEEAKRLRRAQEVRCVALGEDVPEAELVEVVDVQPRTDAEKIVALESRLDHITNAMDNMFAMIKELRDYSNKDKDTQLKAVIEAKKKEKKIEIPEGTVLTGKTRGLSYFLQVREGGFYVGITRYDSLSAAAEGISGVRRSGWTFWKLSDCRTVKEVFKE